MIAAKSTSRKQSVDDCTQIDIRRLARDGLLKPGSEGTFSEHKSRYAIRSISDVNRVRFLHGTAMLAGFRRLAEDVVDIDATQCHYGGTRPWFLCPQCGRRFAILYVRRIERDGSELPIRARTVKCRRCHDLCYSSQHEEWNRRMRRRSEKIWARIGGRYGGKPKRMHWSTYNRLRDEARYYEELWLYG